MNKKILIPISLIVLGAVFITVGILSGEMFTVLQKSIRICLECVGIG